MSQKTGNIIILIVFLLLSLYFTGSGGRYQDEPTEYHYEESP